MTSDYALLTPYAPTTTICFQTGDQRVTFFPDGRVVYDGTPDEAAKVFWKAVEAIWPETWKRPAISPGQDMTVAEALRTILNAIDYTSGACDPTEMVAAVLPSELIERARKALEETTASPNR